MITTEIQLRTSHEHWLVCAVEMKGKSRNEIKDYNKGDEVQSLLYGF